MRKDPKYFNDHSSVQASFAQYDRLTKREWANAFAEMYLRLYTPNLQVRTQVDPLQIITCAKDYAKKADK